MTRLIKRYGSRKLYDTLESRYVLLEDIAGWVRDGQDINVVDNKTNEDVTAQTLTQVISEEGRKKSSLLSSELLHDLIRAGESGVKQIQQGVDRFVKKSIDRIVPLSRVRDEMSQLRERLDELEKAIADAASQEEPPESKQPAPTAKTLAAPTAAKKPTGSARAAKAAASATQPTTPKTRAGRKPGAGKSARKPAAK